MRARNSVTNARMWHVYPPSHGRAFTDENRSTQQTKHACARTECVRIIEFVLYKICSKPNNNEWKRADLIVCTKNKFTNTHSPNAHHKSAPRAVQPVSHKLLSDISHAIGGDKRPRTAHVCGTHVCRQYNITDDDVDLHHIQWRY